jgi:hypothetical protein
MLISRLPVYLLSLRLLVDFVQIKRFVPAFPAITVPAFCCARYVVDGFAVCATHVNPFVVNQQRLEFMIRWPLWPLAQLLVDWIRSVVWASAL